ncbi:response regulator transcription factor [Agrobacterium tumefaciens]|nr:response regulator transcription factor [Agrobacterium tumefaciens]NTE22274.1 response regulator transcription factor [Agrobacterium tumefaciens]
MKSLLKNNISKKNEENVEHMNSLLPLLANDIYLFLDPKITIQTYSTKTEVFFNQVFKSKIIKGAPFFEQILKEKEVIKALELFLKENLTDELIDIEVYTGCENILVHINKIEHEGKHMGYHCMLERTDDQNNQLKNSQLTGELSELLSRTIKTGNKLIDELHFDLQKHQESVIVVERQLEKLKQDSVAIMSAVEQINVVISKTPPSLTILPRFPNFAITNVMILDDDILVHFAMKSIIKSALPGINVFSFVDMGEAVEFLETYPTDIILMDLEMLSSSDWSFFNLIEKQGVKAPVVIISTKLDQQTLKTIPKFPQIKGILTKPIDKKHLLNILSK